MSTYTAALEIHIFNFVVAWLESINPNEAIILFFLKTSEFDLETLIKIKWGDKEEAGLSFSIQDIMLITEKYWQRFQQDCVIRKPSTILG